ncbi:MAG: sigma-54 dependent transcriptional regulator [Myxococcota bacterium]|nr:sigma-54 dependent transcriptional regulator [Myxococcota bacterium]
MTTVLIIDDNDTLREGVSAVCSRLGYTTLSTDSGEKGLKLLQENDTQLVVTDLKMDGLDGIDVLKSVLENNPNTAVVIMTGYATVETAVEAIKLGAFDFIEKPFSTDRIRAKIQQALEWQSLRVTKDRLQEAAQLLSGARDRKIVSDTRGYDEMIGQSGAMRTIFKKIEKLAVTDASVHIFGESGTGKELVANAIHNNSKRKDGPLVKVNCGALTDSLLESELFGHEKGAFTGAIKRKLGRFELAHKGTIFLDEIGEITPAMQVKLLRVLQEGIIERVGGEKSVKIDVRIISATNRDLEKEVAEGRFRQDLFYRLHIVPLTLPPLRERTDDIEPLARHFVEKLKARTNPEIESIDEGSIAQLRNYHFPGNVRELENIIEQALVFADPPVLTPDDLPAQVTGRAPQLDQLQISTGNLGLNQFLENAERQMILSAYEAANGVKTETARRLKIKASALYYKLEKYGIGTITSRPTTEKPET